MDRIGGREKLNCQSTSADHDGDRISDGVGNFYLGKERNLLTKPEKFEIVSTIVLTRKPNEICKRS